MAVAEVDEVRKYKAEWQAAKARNKELNQAYEDLRRESKNAFDALADADSKLAAAEDLRAEFAVVSAALAACEKECSDLRSRLARAKKESAAAKKIAEGISELG